MKTCLKSVLHGIPVLCLAFVVAIICVSCASPAKVVDLTPVLTIPPNSDGGDLGTHGYLLVNTPTETRWDERSVRHFTHTGYTIYDPATQSVVKYVPNRYGVADGESTLVLLPSGTYLVEAQSVYHQPIRFPVVIRPATQTTVNLQTDTPIPKTFTGSFYTLQYHGQLVGWLEETKAM